MDLGNTIYKLRTKNHMSQGDLANALEVSRQSISKWETNSSVPELDKLIKLSEIFDVSLDELVLNNNSPVIHSQQIIKAESSAPNTTQKTAGIILLCFGGLIWLMITLLGDILSGLVFASPFLFCGLICLFVLKNAGLWCSWAVYCIADVYLRAATGANLILVFRSFQYEIGLTAHVLIAWIQLICYLTLSIITVLRFRFVPLMSLRKNTTLAVTIWVSWVALKISSMLVAMNNATHGAPGFLCYIIDESITILFTAAITFTVRSVLQLLHHKK